MPDDFASRQLNDTGYAARQAMAFLKRLWPDVGPTAHVTVQAVTGRVTAQLRERWQLNHILADDGEKTRDDHRHHAIDALAVACAHGGYTQKLSHYFENGQRISPWRGPKPDDAVVLRPGRRSAPTPNARSRKSSSRIACARRSRGRCIWRRHTAIPGSTRKRRAEPIACSSRASRSSACRRAKSKISSTTACGTVVRDWVAAHGGDPKKAFASFPRVSEGGAEIRKVRLRSKQQLSLMAPVSTGYADLGIEPPCRDLSRRGRQDRARCRQSLRSRAAAREARADRAQGSRRRRRLRHVARARRHAAFSQRERWPAIGRSRGLGARANRPCNRVNDAERRLRLTRPMAGSLDCSRRRDKVAVDPIGRVRPAND